MRNKLLYALTIASLVSPFTVAYAQSKASPDRDPNAVDVVKTPVTDLNIDKDEIPELLIEAQRQPYDLSGINSCAKLTAAIVELDDLLGPDIDLPQEERDKITAGRVAKTVVSTLIPFRGLVREVSGANQHERRVRAAIQAGLARRGFLKGIGQWRNCPYPARPADRMQVASRLMELNKDVEEKSSDTSDKD